MCLLALLAPASIHFMSDTVDFQFLARKIDQVLDQGRRLDQQHLQVLEALLLLQKTVVNLDRRMSDVKDELELTIKIELGGRLANMEAVSKHGRNREPKTF